MKQYIIRLDYNLKNITDFGFKLNNNNYVKNVNVDNDFLAIYINGETREVFWNLDDESFENKNIEDFIKDLSASGICLFVGNNRNFYYRVKIIENDRFVFCKKVFFARENATKFAQKMVDYKNSIGGKVYALVEKVSLIKSGKPDIAYIKKIKCRN